MFAPNAPAPTDKLLSDTTPTPPPATVFVFDLHNRRYLDGSSKQVHLQPANTPFLNQIYLLGFALFTACVALQGGLDLFRWLITNVAGTTTQGYVVDRRVLQGKSTSYTLVYAFTVGAQRYEVSQWVDSSVYEKADEFVQVTYWRPNPNFARLSGKFEVGNMFFASAFLFACPGIFVVPMVALTIFGFRGWRVVVAKQRRLRDAGSLIYGKVISSTGQKLPKQGYKLTVRYGFRTPDSEGRWEIREEQRTLSGLRRQSLPAQNRAVAIIYADDKNVEML